MLNPRDGAEKDEREQTGGKRLIRRLHERHGHFADVIVGDALYLNAPFLNTVLECGMDAVIRLKDEKRLIFQDAESLFAKNEGRQESFTAKDKRIEIWDMSRFEIKGVERKLRVIKAEEYQKRGREKKRNDVACDNKRNDG